MGSKKNYLLLDWLDSQSIVSVLTLSGHGSPLFLEQLMGPRPLAGGHTSMGAYERLLIKGVPLFIENIEATRCVLLVPHQIPLKEFTRLRKKSETKGGLDPICTGCWVPRTGCPVKEPQAEAQLEFILIQQDLRVQFAHIVVKRQLVTEMEVLRTAKKQCTNYEAATSDPKAQQPSGSLPGAGLPAPINSVKWDIPTTSLAAGAPRSAAALGQPAPHGSGARRSDQGGQEELSHVFEYEAHSQPLPSGLPHSGPGPAESFLQDEIALDIGLGGLAAAQFGKPTALDVLRQDVEALGHETRELHGRVNRRVPASALKGLRRSLDALAYEAHGQMPSYEPQWYSPHSAYGYSS
ncbi:ATP-binding cassette (ABC) Superfamily [Phytophthora palmivora]|uniref:ATP-binding cassette (ABC) Superfamily n=1 Tax=Phytophthora palmivora TaxID=4796 RepID=A0A2P4X366_9STRA|nr:ATP-binding cassette (ABC) Superfamily [Phytophthora palmivora]